MGSNVKKSIKMLVLLAEPEETTIWLCWTIVCLDKKLSLTTCPPGKLSSIQLNENNRYQNFKSLKIIEVGRVEEGLRQVGHEVYLADGEVFSSPGYRY